MLDGPKLHACRSRGMHATATQSDDVHSNVLKQSNTACKTLLLCVDNGTQGDPMKQCRAIERPMTSDPMQHCVILELFVAGFVYMHITQLPVRWLVRWR